MKHIDRVTVWRRNKKNEHKLLVIKSTWDGSWVVVDYNSEIPNRKFATHRAAINHAAVRASARSVDRIVRRRWDMVGGDAA